MIAYRKLLTYQNTKAQDLGFKRFIVKIIVFLFPQSDIGAKLKFYNAFIQFLTFIGIHLINKFNWQTELKKGVSEAQILEVGDSRIVRALLNFLVDLKLAQKVNLSYQLNGSHRALKKDSQKLNPSSKTVKSYQFIENLIKKYRTIKSGVPASPNDIWSKLIVTGKLDYEIRLCETLIQLPHISLNKKYQPTFHDSYYTGSGENAFNNLTKSQFQKALTYIYTHNSFKSVLDVGCGYGEHIQALNKLFPSAFITGIELQRDVFLKTAHRFSEQNNIRILNQNIFDVNFQHAKFDLILFNYVLFYFNEAQKKALLQLLKTISSENVRLLVCQYYPGLDAMKTALAKKQKNYGFARAVEMYYSNRILYANTLWNEVVNTFALAEHWDEFENLLKQNGFEITAITHADRFYYSLFIEIKKTSARP